MCSTICPSASPPDTPKTLKSLDQALFFNQNSFPAVAPSPCNFLLSSFPRPPTPAPSFCVIFLLNPHPQFMKCNLWTALVTHRPLFFTQPPFYYLISLETSEFSTNITNKSHTSKKNLRIRKRDWMKVKIYFWKWIVVWKKLEFCSSFRAFCWYLTTCSFMRFNTFLTFCPSLSRPDNRMLEGKKTLFSEGYRRYLALCLGSSVS